MDRNVVCSDHVSSNDIDTDGAHGGAIHHYVAVGRGDIDGGINPSISTTSAVNRNGVPGKNGVV